jgi:hypothetical protein
LTLGRALGTQAIRLASRGFRKTETSAFASDARQQARALRHACDIAGENAI